MLSEQQQRIMGYFIEEAKDHLNTIEQGLLNLQGTIEDPEMVNEVFRAAHSVKGGAAMLGLTSIQHAAHRLEDYFKILKECPIEIDQTLETLFLKIFDALQALLEQLQGPFGLTDDKSAEVMAGVEPIFQELNRRFSGLIGQISDVLLEDVDLSILATVRSALTKAVPTEVDAPAVEESALQLIFQSDVPVRLREMLQLFKQKETPDSRQELQALCLVLGQYGDPLDLFAWCKLLDDVRRAIANPENSYRVLAPIIIKEVKQAQELVLSRRSTEILASNNLTALLPLQDESDVDDLYDFADMLGSMELSGSGFDEQTNALSLPKFDNFVAPVYEFSGAIAASTQADLLANDDWFNDAVIQEASVVQEESVLHEESRVEAIALDDALFEAEFESEFSLNFNEADFATSTNPDLSLSDHSPSQINPPVDSRTGSEVGITELNSLADLFAGEMPDLDLTWQAEEVISDIHETPDFCEAKDQNADNEFSDLLFDDPDQSDYLVLDDLAEEDLSGLLDSGFSQPQSQENLASQSSATFSEDPLDLDAITSDDPFGMDWIDSPISMSSDQLVSIELTDELNTVGSDEQFELNLSDDLAIASDDRLTLSAEQTAESGELDLGDALPFGELDDLSASIFGGELEEASLFELADEAAQPVEAAMLEFNLEPKLEAAEDEHAFFSLDDSTAQPQSHEAEILNLDNSNLGNSSLENIATLDFSGLEESTELDFSNLSDHSESDSELCAQDIDLDSFRVENTATEGDVDDSILSEPFVLSLGSKGNGWFTDESDSFHAGESANFDINDIFAGDRRAEILVPSEQFEISEAEEFVALNPIRTTETSDDFSDLEAMLGETVQTSTEAAYTAFEPKQDNFDNLDALLNNATPTTILPVEVTPNIPPMNDEFGDLEDLLKDADQALGGSLANRKITSAPNRRSHRRGILNDQTMRVSVKHLDNLNNLVGEMVVNRNSLEQAQERLRQFLDNLLYQVQQLSDVGQRMRDLYERSLLESSLLSTRRSYHLKPQNSSGYSSGFGGGHDNSSNHASSNHETGESFDALEMDRFTGFHTLSQEMIELIVRVRESASDIDFVVEESDQVTRNFRQITTQLQEGLTRARMVPFAQTADRLPRGVRDNALKYGKQAELLVEGRDTLIDKMIVEHLYDPITHLVNNAVAHGVETAAERIALGKPPTGKIVLRTFHQGNQTIISVSDDGAGIDQERVKSRAIAEGLITAAEAKEMSRMDTYDLLFHHGFSTADQIDDLKGRGVGLDVVRSNLNEIRGAISIDSTVGKGTTFTIRLPLTLSISKALCCISNRARIAFPMDGVEDMLDVPKERVQIDAQGRSCIYWRDALLPFQPLTDLLKHGRILGRGSVYGGNQEDDIISIVVLRSTGNNLALQVDQVLGEQEIVIKQLEGPVPKPIGIAGATVMGDGRIMPIADVLELIDLAEGRIRRDAGSSLWEMEEQLPPEAYTAKTEPTVLIVDDSITVRELLSMTFNKVGYRVEQARDGQEAWEKLRSGLPCDLVFCDIEMPRMDGLELLSRLQKDPSLSHLPIAMLTSRGADRHRQMAVQLGAKGYFTKPYLEEALLDAAQRMLKGEVLVNKSASVL
jgi:chemotaxis protein histidine kinase CheA/ActR/RegA family two-component response regulator